LSCRLHDILLRRSIKRRSKTEVSIKSSTTPSEPAGRRLLPAEPSELPAAGRRRPLPFAVLETSKPKAEGSAANCGLSSLPLFATVAPAICR
jgi:hypothetical protein